MQHSDTLLFYINAIHEGGAERVILQLAHHFSEIGYRSIVVTSFIDSNEYPVPDNVERISIEHKQIIQSSLKRNCSRIIALRRICKKYKPKALISFMGEANFRAICATIGLPVKSIVSVRNDPNIEYGGKVGRFVGKHIIPCAAGCVFQTEDAKKWFSKRLQEKSKIIFNDVDKVFFDTDYVGGNDIVTLGRLSDQKNQKMLIESFANLASDFPESNLMIYGIGPLKEELEAYIDELNMRNRVFLNGLTSDAPGVLSMAKLFVLSSDYEGMPNGLMEALAIGVPCISTDCPCGGPRVLIEDGVNGLLVPVNDAERMNIAMRKILANHEFAKKLHLNAKMKSQIYKTDVVFNEWKTYVETVISKK